MNIQTALLSRRGANRGPPGISRQLDTKPHYLVEEKALPCAYSPV